MTISSAVGIAKLGALAAVLSSEDFALYASAFALVGITSSLISLGLVEGTVKEFTRLIAFNRTADLREKLWKSVRIITIRHASMLVVVIAGLAWYPNLLLQAAAVVLLAYAANCISIVSSVLRGYNRMAAMGANALVRSISALVFSVAGAFLSWRIGLLSEAISATFVGLICLLYLRSVVRVPHQDETHLSDPHPVASKKDGFFLFAAYTIGLLPVSFDRLWLVHFSAQETASQYAFTGIWISAATLIAAIYVQKLGPELIRRRALLGTSSFGAAIMHAIAVALMLAIGAAAAFLVARFAFPDIYWSKYGLTLGIAAATVAVSALQISIIFDWALIASDGEAGVFVSAVTFAAISISLFFLSSLLGLGTISYLLSLGAARLGQLLVAAIWAYRIHAIQRNGSPTSTNPNM